jgi:hypothetical protein
MGLDPVTQDIHALFRILFALLDCEIFEYF